MLMMNTIIIIINVTVSIPNEIFWPHLILKITFSFVFLNNFVTSILSGLFRFQSAILCKQCIKLTQFIVLLSIWG
jgi:hypothetical protein